MSQKLGAKGPRERAGQPAEKAAKRITERKKFMNQFLRMLNGGHHYESR